jgi:hypothetical protein
LRGRSRVCGALRLVLFAAGVTCIVLAFRSAVAWRWAAVASFGLFFVVVAIHVRVQDAERRARRRRLLAEESAARLQGGLGPGAGTELPERPVSPLDAGLAVFRAESAVHALSPWARADLGIEAERGSLRDRLDTTSSQLGARRLLWLLRHPLVDAAAIRARQAAVGELVAAEPLRDVLQLAAFGCRGIPQQRLPAFLASRRLLPGGFLRIAALLVAITCLPSILLAAAGVQEFLPAAGATLASAFGLHLATARRARALRDAYLELEPLVTQALDVAPALAAHTPQSAWLGEERAVLGAFTTGNEGQRLRAIAVWLRCLHLHETGFFYGLVQFVTLWDLHWLLALETAVKGTPERWERLAGALADLEAHTALAVFAAEQPAVVFPQILDSEPPGLVLEAGEHPLLDVARSVPNDLRLGGEARLAIVTGSNMAGKSTFLRMVALNVHLAQMGLPVRARAMHLTPLALHANINVRDSLADGKSYFFVEVERVRDILAAAAGDPVPVLGVFDELFRGTNSRERLAASREIARTLAASGDLFLLATHDQELARLVTDEAVPGIFLLHFRDEIDAGAMVFPYRVRPGVASTHNALRLLEIAGYPAELVERARQHAEGAGEGL